VGAELQQGSTTTQTGDGDPLGGDGAGLERAGGDLRRAGHGGQVAARFQAVEGQAQRVGEELQ
jgi:hypothetical protein